MFRRVLLLATFAIFALVAVGLGNDEVIVRSKDKPFKGPIQTEGVRGVEIKGINPIPADDILDIHYDVKPVEVLINLYRPAYTAEKDYNDPDPKKEGVRKTKLTEALKKFAEAYAKVDEKNAKRHIQFKLAVLTARQAQDSGADLEPAIKKLFDFKILNKDCWQLVPCLQLLARLQADTKQFTDAEETYLELAALDVSDDVKQEAELMAAQVGIRAGKQGVSMKKLDALLKKLPKDSKFRVKARIATAECLVAAGKNADAIALLRQVNKETTDKSLKAIAYNTLGLSYLKSEQLKEARWEFLWVDVVYNQDKAEHAKALYYLSQIFDKLEEKDRAQECRETLITDRAFAGSEWQRRAQKEMKK